MSRVITSSGPLADSRLAARAPCRWEPPTRTCSRPFFPSRPRGSLLWPKTEARPFADSFDGDVEAFESRTPLVLDAATRLFRKWRVSGCQVKPITSSPTTCMSLLTLPEVRASTTEEHSIPQAGHSWDAVIRGMPGGLGLPGRPLGVAAVSLALKGVIQPALRQAGRHLRSTPFTLVVLALFVGLSLVSGSFLSGPPQPWLAFAECVAGGAAVR